MIFNHRFASNLDRLEAVYGSRFPSMRSLMPFSVDERPDVIPTHFPSNLFHGYVAEAYDRIRAVSASHYVFAADDLFLNPVLTGANFARCLGLGEDTGYIKSLTPLGDATFKWPHLFRAVRALERRDPKVRWRREVPPPARAADLLRRHANANHVLTWTNLRAPTGSFFYRPRRMAAGWFDIVRHLGRHVLPYPAVMGYSDLVVVPAPAFAEFARLCGVFAAAGLFVEVSIPTALALSCSSILCEADTRWRGIEHWKPEEMHALERRLDGKLDRLIEWMPDDVLYVHPVKLSRWTSEDRDG